MNSLKRVMVGVAAAVLGLAMAQQASAQGTISLADTKWKAVVRAPGQPEEEMTLVFGQYGTVSVSYLRGGQLQTGQCSYQVNGQKLTLQNGQAKPFEMQIVSLTPTVMIVAQGGERLAFQRIDAPRPLAGSTWKTTLQANGGRGVAYMTLKTDGTIAVRILDETETRTLGTMAGTYTIANGQMTVTLTTGKVLNSRIVKQTGDTLVLEDDVRLTWQRVETF